MILTLFNTLAQYGETAEFDHGMWLPLDPFLLLLLKFFVVFTCVFFWIKFIYDRFMSSYRVRHNRHDR
ncbi:MAG: hypothetical protein ACI9OU_000302 [Candidatus Promineifilaceae bacterium]|jgi:hypothetical protein